MELSSTLPMDLCDSVETSGGFAELRKQVKEAGLLKQQPLYYVWQVLWCCSLLSLSIAVLTFTESIWWHLLDAPLLAFAFTQTMLLGHDAGHRQIGRIGTAILYACSMCVGMSPLAWLDVHNAHHAHPNREDMDPDIEQPFLAYSNEQVLERKEWWLARLVMRNQAVLYFPLLTFVAWSIRNTGVQYLKKLPLRQSWLDWLSFVIHFSLYLGILFVLLPWWHAVLFIVVHQIVWGIYVGSIFAPNHKGMEMLEKDLKIDFVREQVMTARNIRPGFFIDLWYGGLNYQIEHHLFPVMPRKNLPKLRLLVREHCRLHGIPYHETGIRQSYREILTMMSEIAAFARRLPDERLSPVWNTEDIIHKVKLTLLVVLPFLAMLLAIILLWQRYVFTTDLVLLGVFYAISVFGVTIGYHRMLTHNGFHAPAWLRAVLLICGCTSFETDPATWASMHIKHHAHSDEEDDPHSPLHGFWHSHMGWLFTPHNYLDAKQYAPHLLEDPVVVFVSKTWFVWAFLGLLIPGLIGGWTGFLWGGLVRLFLVSHATYSVNSICHTFGRRTFETTDESRNEWIVGLLAFGEGWHNNHHAFPSNAFHGMRWWQLDISGLIIRGLEAVGLVWDVQRVAPDVEVAQRSRMQAMRDTMGQLRQNVLSSVTSARDELLNRMSRFTGEPITHEQLQECIRTHEQAMVRFDAMAQNISTSANLKRQKLLQYQKEADRLMAECGKKWAVVTGKATTA